MIPTFTILIATYNAATLLPRTLDSLAAQSCRDFNVIIQDGASSDDTVAVAQSYADKVPALLLDSVKDRGIYDAWNKALDRWQGDLGEWVLFLGAGDELVSKTTLLHLKMLLQEAPSEILFAGGTVVKDSTSGIETLSYAYKPDLFDKHRLMLPHSAMFHRKQLFFRATFDTRFKILGDRAFLCKHWNMNNGNFIIPFAVTKMQRGGISDNPRIIGHLRYEAFIIKQLYETMSIKETISGSIGVLKGYIIALFYIIFRKNAPDILNFIQRIRGKEPRWKYDEL